MDFGRFGSRVGRSWNPMVLDTPGGHLKQQVSVTLIGLDRQKVHKVGQLSELAWLAAPGGLWHLG